MASGVVLGRMFPCDVPQGYASVAMLPAASLVGHFEHPSYRCREMLPACLVSRKSILTICSEVMLQSPFSLQLCLRKSASRSVGDWAGDRRARLNIPEESSPEV